jgi:hypothetical protein
MEITAHPDLLDLHVDLPQQIVGRYFLVGVAEQPALSQEFEAEILGLGVLRLG